MAVACPIHAVALEHVCGVCDKKVIWIRGKMGQCRCGARLDETLTRSVSEPMRNLMATLRSALYKDDAHVPTNSEINILASLDLQQLCKLIWGLTTLNAEDAVSVGRIRSRSFSAEGLDGISVALSNWPLGFQQLLSQRVEPHIAFTEITPSFPLTFRWFFKGILRCEKDETQFAFMEHELYRFGARYWHPQDDVSRSPHRLFPDPFAVGKSK